MSEKTIELSEKTSNTESKKSIQQPTPTPQQNTDIVIDLSTEIINIISKETGISHKFYFNNKLKLLQTNLYVIPITQNLNSDDYHVIKQFSSYADKFQVLTVKDKTVIINPLISNSIEITDKMVVAKLI